MITFATVASQKYVDYAKALVSSAFVHQPDAKFFVELINVTKQERKDFVRRNPQCEVILDTMKPGMEERVYCSNQKGPLLSRIRESGNTDMLMWIDADSIIRKPVDSILEYAQKDMCIRIKPTKKIMEGLNVNECYSGVFTFGNTPGGNEHLKMLRQLTSNEKKVYWASDQDYLSYVFAVCQSQNRNTHFLPDTFLDFKMKSDSLLWTLKCTPKTINARFHREHRKYLEM